jgi:hypothetical protein
MQLSSALPGIRTDMTRTLCVAPIERDHADHRSVEIDHEKSEAPPGHVRHGALELSTRPRAPMYVPTSGEANSSMNAARSRSSVSRRSWISGTHLRPQRRIQP